MFLTTKVGIADRPLERARLAHRAEPSHARCANSRPGTTNGPPRPKTPRAVCGSPEQIRTAVSALRGRRPRPLDDGAVELGGEDSNPQRQGQNLLCCRLHHPRRAGRS